MVHASNLATNSMLLIVLPIHGGPGGTNGGREEAVPSFAGSQAETDKVVYILKHGKCGH